jgi:hypothetical protein
MPLEPEAGELWKWFGGQHFLLLQKKSQYGDKFVVLELATGSIKDMYFHKSEIGSSWIKVA